MYYVLFSAIPAASLAIFAVFIKLAKSTFRKEGYRKPTIVKTSTCLSLSVAFIVIYVLIYLFPGFPTGFLYQGIETDPLLIISRIASAILYSLAAESIFRGHIFRSLLKNNGFFTSLYASSILFSLSQVSIKDLIGLNLQQITFYIFTNIVPLFAAGLFLGFFFYKIGWSLLGPVIFRVGVRFFLDPLPIVSPAGAPIWWESVTMEMFCYVALILILDSVVKEPRYVRKQYGLEG
jgi:hypothetical protein